MWRWLSIAALVLVGLWFFRSGSVVPAGVLAPNAPEQHDISGAPAFSHGGYRITPLARFDIEARILGREDYRLDREAQLAPIDLALGWGRMSDPDVLKQVSITQGRRFYFWRVEEFPIPRAEIERSSANMHLIPADDAVRAQLERLGEGQVVRLAGKLVRADAEDGWHWISSLRRDDTGRGACELVYVEAVSVR